MDLEHLQQLAGLDLDDEECRELADDLRQLRDSIDRLESVDVSGVQPALHPVDPRSEPRGDSAGEPLSKRDVFSNAPEQSGDYFSVPSNSSTDDDDE